ncbi:MAG: hypothetical protein L6R41_006606 [Letrouitia leprolyta]|nr:MAG: hypothetical protein L6R41_006606 [Letrouitia leprolyta]
MASSQVDLTLDEGPVKSTLDRLPPELLREICSYLSPPDLRQCRLVSASFGFAGESFLLPILHLTFEFSSFERLKEICEKPAVCFGVREIHYRIDHLVRAQRVFQFATDKRRSKEIRRSTFIAPNQLLPDWIPTVLQLDRVLIDIANNPKHYSAQDFLNIHTALHNKLQEQERIRQIGDNSILFIDALQMMPNVTAIHMDGLPHEDESSLTPEFRHKLTSIYGDYDLNERVYDYGASQLRSLLNAMVEARRPLKYLKCNSINSRIFSQKGTFETMTAGVQQLKHLELRMFPAVSRNGSDDFRLTGRAPQFIAAAPNLESLYLHWNLKWGYNLELRWVVGNHTWPFLRTLHLIFFEAEDSFLRAFLRRHAATLRDLKLAICRLKDGPWAPMFLFMRTQLSLEAFKAYNLTQWVDTEKWIPCSSHVAQTSGRLEFNPHNDKLKDIISRYVIGNGHAPLLHRKQQEFGEYLVDDGQGGLRIQKGEP